MSLRIGTGAVLLASAVAATSTSAKSPMTFDVMAVDSILLPSPDAARELLWASRGRCKGAAGSFDRLQCDALRAHAAAEVASAVYRLDVPAVVQYGPYSEKKRSAVISVHGCIDCAMEPNLVAGRGRFVRQGQRLLGPVVKNKTVVFKNKRAYLAAVAIGQRARTEFLFRASATGSKVIAFSLLGFRTYDPCDGSVLLAAPISAERSPQSRFCPERPAD